jgi:molybdenum-dependent DNA-binding transcriptional regulator ModE
LICAWIVETLTVPDCSRTFYFSYQYLEGRRRRENIPAVWMPRLSELTQAGRPDLLSAIRRFGGAAKICRQAGLVSFREWNYIEGMLELLGGLKDYLDRYHGGNYRTFPTVTLVKERRYDRLYSLIQYYGGRQFLAARLDMDLGVKGRRLIGQNDLLSSDMNWGPFDLEFGIDLLAFVREQELNRKPPLRQYPVIMIPSQWTLLEHGERGQRLDAKIQEYGGYENVARRLGLEFSDRTF